jgi:hypothetical protein
MVQVQKIKSGVYKVKTDKGIFMIRGGASFNSDSKFFKNGGYEIWTASSNEECNDENCWAYGAQSKKIALQVIKDFCG